MLYDRIKKFLASVFRKKKKGYASFSSDLHVRGAATEIGNYKNRLHRITKIRQRIQAKKREYQEEYSRPLLRSKMYVRLGVLLLLVSVLPLVWVYGGGEKILQGLQSIAFFRVARIEITGCTAVSKEKILNVSGIIPQQTNLLTLNSKEIEARIAAVPWVARSVVKRSWPAKVQISIEEIARE